MSKRLITHILGKPDALGRARNVPEHKGENSMFLNYLDALRACRALNKPISCIKKLGYNRWSIENV